MNTTARSPLTFDAIMERFMAFPEAKPHREAYATSLRALKGYRLDVRKAVRHLPADEAAPAMLAAMEQSTELAALRKILAKLIKQPFGTQPREYRMTERAYQAIVPLLGPHDIRRKAPRPRQPQIIVVTTQASCILPNLRSSVT